ncbi:MULTISPECIES: hypothetical protein [unclassified Variovorax]|uniref:hypothetical protein n=1 Tax=unclassified Variovorax TaxID=663243 RepID=UPI000838DE79|nr:MULTISPECIES: hypothetical protein [unclassified Variovorax]PNG50323.1 hypothetical protein CHC06_05946 [Variovorax sp. B2]PNG51196.1 hypothetical protein CHC07_05852 [Variovorax sp. B4]VTV17419.1 hypothetical protein WDL1P1_00373 [Variovorax sp. WDL1]
MPKHAPATQAALDALKAQVRDRFHDVKPGHRTEAIAAGLGFRNFAALGSHLDDLEPPLPAMQPNAHRMAARLAELGYSQHSSPRIPFSHSEVYEFACQDGTDPNCAGRLREKLPYEGLSDEQVEQVIKDLAVDLTPDDVDRNQLDLSRADRAELADRGFVRLAVSFRVTCCPACGSDG